MRRARSVVGFVGSHRRLSKARFLVETIAARLMAQHAIELRIFDLHDTGPALCAASRSGLDPQSRALIGAIEGADGLVIGCPVFQGSYPGLFKHVFDLVHPLALRNRPVLLTAVGGGVRHSLVVEHQLRPLFGFFEAATISTALYACADELEPDVELPEILAARLANAVTQFALQLSAAPAATPFAAMNERESCHAWF